MLADRVAAVLPDWQVLSATLAAPGSLEEKLETAVSRPWVYPLFMTDGWFVRSALPKRIGGVPVSIMPPLGVEAGLPGLVATVLNAALQDKGWTARDTQLLVASHGSGRSPKSKEATETFVAALRHELSFGDVKTGYVEEPPHFEDIAQSGQDRSICLPFFAAYGGHVKEDITDALTEADFKGLLLDPIGTFEAIPEFVAQSLRNASAASNPET